MTIGLFYNLLNIRLGLDVQGVPIIFKEDYHQTANHRFQNSWPRLLYIFSNISNNSIIFEGNHFIPYCTNFIPYCTIFVYPSPLQLVTPILHPFFTPIYNCFLWSLQQIQSHLLWSAIFHPLIKKSKFWPFKINWNPVVVNNKLHKM